MPAADRHSAGIAWLEWLVFPAVMFGTFLGWGVLVQVGQSPAVATMVVTAMAAVVILSLERIMPYHPAWNDSQDDIPTDATHLVVSMLVLPELARVLMLGGFVAFNSWLVARLGTNLWPTEWAVWLQVVLALVVGEFGTYWSHRLAHEWPMLWRFHATHHSAGRLYWLNAARFHPVDALIAWASAIPVLIVLGCGEHVLALFLATHGVHGMFQHANIRLRLGPLNWVFSMAELHRWHHSRTIVESNANYGANLILWDVVFGTRFLPSDRRPPRVIGIADMPDFPSTYLGQLASPLRWRRIRPAPSVRP
jgi:ornithine lipid hydroxylase